MTALPEKAIKKSLSSSVIKIDASGAGDFGFKTVSKRKQMLLYIRQLEMVYESGHDIHSRQRHYHERH